MFEVRIVIEAPELAGALNNLAASIGGAKFIPQQGAEQPKMSNPAPQQTVAAPTPQPQMQQPAPQPNPLPSPGPAAYAAPSYPAPNVPLAQPPKYTVDQIMAAGATLMDAGKVNELMNLLHSFGVQAVMDLKPEQLGAFATGLRELGAKI